MNPKDVEYITKKITEFCEQLDNQDLYDLTYWFSLGSIIDLDPPQIALELINSNIIGYEVYSDWKKEKTFGVHGTFFNVIKFHLLCRTLDRFKKVVL